MHPAYNDITKKAPTGNCRDYNYKLYTQNSSCRLAGFEFSQESVWFFTIQKGVNGIDLTLIFIIGAYFKLTIIAFYVIGIIL